MNRNYTTFAACIMCIAMSLLFGCENDASSVPGENTSTSGDDSTAPDSSDSPDSDSVYDLSTDLNDLVDTDNPEETDTPQVWVDWDDFWGYQEPDTALDTDTGPQTLQIIEELPDGFSHANMEDSDSSYGGFAVVGPLDEHVVHDEDAICANVIRVVVRDFVMAHGDFQDDWSTSAVEPALGDDKKPVASDANMSRIATEWYRNIEDVNLPYAVDLWLEPVGDTFVFDTPAFFPIDGYGFDETCICGDQIHNFHFTTEMHARFEYHGGEEFTFIGDDDVYVYINNQLVVDLGGVHNPETGTVILDDVAEDLSLQVGEIYPIDLFQAERQTCGSNFRIETTLDFSGCGIILPTDIVVE